MIYEFRPFAEEVTALRLGAGGGRLDYMCVMLQGVRTLVLEEEGGLYRVRQDLSRPPLQGS